MYYTTGHFSDTGGLVHHYSHPSAQIDGNYTLENLYGQFDGNYTLVKFVCCVCWNNLMVLRGVGVFGTTKYLDGLRSKTFKDDVAGMENPVSVDAWWESSNEKARA